MSQQADEEVVYIVDRRNFHAYVERVAASDPAVRILRGEFDARNPDSGYRFATPEEIERYQSTPDSQSQED